MERSDAELIAACRAGDEAAWAAIIARYERLIWSIPRRAGLDDDAAADVFQQVWVTLLEHIDRLAQPERLQAWLVTTARRASWRMGRGERAAPLPDDDTDPIADRGALPDEIAADLEERHGVHQALAALDERCRQLLTWLFVAAAPLSYGEIAARLGIREGSIGPTRARCLAKLQRALP